MTAWKGRNQTDALRVCLVMYLVCKDVCHVDESDTVVSLERPLQACRLRPISSQ